MDFVYWITVLLMSVCSFVSSLCPIYKNCSTDCKNSDKPVRLSPMNPFAFIGEEGIFNCQLPTKAILNSSTLYFSIRNEERVDKKYYRVISPKELQLRLPITNASYDETVISCHIGGHVVQQRLLVDYTPRQVSRKRVVIHDWRYIYISWDLGTYIRDPLVQTQWRTAQESSWRMCNKKNSSYCELGPEAYREDTLYSITITVTSRCTNRSEQTHFNFNSEDFVQPAAVNWMKALSVGSRCVYLEWNHTHSDSRNLTYRLSLRPTNKNDREKTDQWMTSQRTSARVCALTADTEYRVSVRVKPARGGLWSDLWSINFTTLEDYPEEGAMTTEGGFAEEECQEGVRVVYVYLVPPEELFWNGKLTHYSLVYVPAGARSNISDTAEIDSVFHQVHLSCSLEYDVYISVYNKIGSSPPSHLHIPRQDKVAQPGFIRIESSKKTFKLIWESPLRSFTWTLVWCRATSGICQKRLQWQTIASTKTAVPISYSETSLYGVSLHTSTGSSGVVWSRCLYDVDKVPSPPGALWVVYREDYSLTVRWDSRTCEDNTLVTSYTLQHCRDSHNDCQEVTLANDYREYVIRGLDGGVNYSVRVRKTTVSGKRGPFSQPVFAVTGGISRTVIIIIGLASSVVCAISLSTVLVCLRNTSLKWKEKELIVLPLDTQTYASAVVVGGLSGTADGTHRTVLSRRTESDDSACAERQIADSPAQTYLVHNDKSARSDTSATHSSCSYDTDVTGCVDPYVTAGNVIDDAD